MELIQTMTTFLDHSLSSGGQLTPSYSVQPTLKTSQNESQGKENTPLGVGQNWQGSIWICEWGKSPAQHGGLILLKMDACPRQLSSVIVVTVLIVIQWLSLCDSAVLVLQVLNLLQTINPLSTFEQCLLFPLLNKCSL